MGFAFTKSMQMSDKTFNFMMYLKLYRPITHDNLITMVYMGVGHGRFTVKKIFDIMAIPLKFPWKVNDINVFQLRADLMSGVWESKTWGKLTQGEVKNENQG